MLESIRMIFLKKEPNVPSNAFDEIIQVINSKSELKKIAIKTSSLGNIPYPFKTSEKFLENLIKKIKENSNAEIIVVDPEKDEKINIPIDLDGIKEVQIPKDWAKSDLRISIDSIRVHKHHFEATYKGIIYNLIDLLDKKTITEFKRIGIEFCLKELFDCLKKFEYYAIADARLIGKSDEHSFFLKSQEFNKIITTKEVKKVDREFCEELELVFLPEYLD